MMKLIYNSITISLPKNIIQFLLGIVLFWMVFGTLSIATTILAMVGFVLTYSSIYMFNDIIDAKEDKKDPEKKKWKLIASGDLSVEGAMSTYVLLIVSGMLVSLLVSQLFAIMMLVLLFLNFLHSSTYIHLKKSMYKTSANLTLIEFIKYSSGWFALTTNLVLFPFWLVLMLSVAYTISYIVYKFRFTGDKIRSNKLLFVPLGLVCTASYILAFIVYDFSLALIIMFLGSGLIIGLAKKSGFNLKRINNMMFVEYLVLPLVIISLLVISLPIVSSVNQDLTVFIQKNTHDILGINSVKTQYLDQDIFFIFYFFQQIFPTFFGNTI